MTLEKRISKLLIVVTCFISILFISSQRIYAEDIVEHYKSKDTKTTIIAIESEGVPGEYFIESEPAIDYTQEDLTLLATIIFAEAGICDDMEEYRVGNVVLNRVNDSSGSFKDTIRGVIFQSGQFTSVGSKNWNNGPTERELEIAQKLLEGTRVLPQNVVWFSKKYQYGELYYTSEWHQYSGWNN